LLTWHACQMSPFESTCQAKESPRCTSALQPYVRGTKSWHAFPPTCQKIIEIIISA